MVVVSCKDV